MHTRVLAAHSINSTRSACQRQPRCSINDDSRQFTIESNRIERRGFPGFRLDRETTKQSENSGHYSVAYCTYVRTYRRCLSRMVLFLSCCPCHTHTHTHTHTYIFFLSLSLSFTYTYSQSPCCCGPRAHLDDARYSASRHSRNEYLPTYLPR